jgi:hypothetical protein
MKAKMIYCEEQGNLPRPSLYKVMFIDISWVDSPYTASACDVMDCRQRRHLHCDGEHLKFYLIPPPPRISFFLGGQR